MKLKTSCLLTLMATNSFAAVDFLRADLSSLSPNGGILNSDRISGYAGGSFNGVNDDVGNVPGNRYNSQLFFDYHKKPTSYSKQVEGRFTLAGQMNDQSLLMYSLQEAYVGGKLVNGDEIKLGRQILDWAPVDKIWGFGKLNNRRNFDYFEPGQEGLIGLQYTGKASSGLRLSIFGSAIYVPETNPGLSIDDKNKTITSKHAWAKAPSREAEVETGKFNRIEYDVDVPETGSVVSRYSGGVNLGIDVNHFRWDAFFIRKPENQISAKADVSVITQRQVVVAEVEPQFYYHDVYGGSVRYNNKDLEMYLSGITVRPNTFPDGDERATRFTEIPTEKRREDYVGGGISRSNDILSYGFNYVARLSPYDRKTDQLAEEPRWNEALNVFASRRIGKYYTVMGDVKYDRLTTDRLVMLRAIYNASKALQLNVGVNMIGTPSDGKSYWSPYANNDAVYGGLRLIF